MDQKKLCNYAKKIHEYQTIYDDPNSSLEDKAKAEKHIMSITEDLLRSPSGFLALCDIDEILQKEYYNKGD